MNPTGEFLDPCDLRVLFDGGAIVFEVLQPFTFCHPSREVTVQPGFQTKAAHSPFYSPLDFSCCLRAGILHDWMIRVDALDRVDADSIFLDALVTSGVRAGLVAEVREALAVDRGGK